MTILDDLAVLGWTLDAFDFFLTVFVIKAVAHDGPSICLSAAVNLMT